MSGGVGPGSRCAFSLEALSQEALSQVAYGKLIKNIVVVPLDKKGDMKCALDC